MEKAYWIARKRASLKMAQSAVGPEARLAHYELAGHYSVKAATARPAGVRIADEAPCAIDALDEKDQ